MPISPSQPPDAQSPLPLTVASDRGRLDIDLGMLGVDLTAPITPRARDAVSISPSRFGAPARAPACNLIVDRTGLSIVGEGAWAAATHGAEGDAAGGSSISAWTGPV